MDFIMVGKTIKCFTVWQCDFIFWAKMSESMNEIDAAVQAVWLDAGV